MSTLPSHPPEGVRWGRRTRIRILLAHDHVLLRDVLRELLEYHGLEVVAVVSDGVDAVAQAEEQQPDVALLASMMSNMNGLDAALEISRAVPSVRIILLISPGDGHSISQGLRNGIRGLV